eukprot:TRINITY_DN43703_c0_g1_i1.p1 TRINITY_DN43703_c0_g1~~TRINITY_DN43703_c0_g1_i1.p1  ORF type:complete len:335 (+),score=23.33 TRINITY_DN43703_c0_g1_i1:134-1138(+)
MGNCQAHVGETLDQHATISFDYFLGQALCSTDDLGQTQLQNKKKLQEVPEEVAEDAHLPSFEHMRSFVPEKERLEMVKCLPRVLGYDASSEHFAQREKAIRFITIIQGKAMAFTQNYFVQNADYNDFSGGYRRTYDLIPDEWVVEENGPVGKMCVQFAEYYKIPEKTVILAQIQTSWIPEKQSASHESFASITGQGIHTDGADRACIVCLHRGARIEGAGNQFHAALDGSAPLCEPLILENGDACYFKDNEIYHYVTRGTVKRSGCSSVEKNQIAGSDADDGSISFGESSNAHDRARTILIMHAPAELYMIGTGNHRNTLGTRVSVVKLRSGSQ